MPQNADAQLGEGDLAEERDECVGADDAIVVGLYRLSSPLPVREPQVRVLASGPLVRAARDAADQLSAVGVAAEVWSVTSWKQLCDDCLTSESAIRRGAPDAGSASHLRRALGVAGPPIVAVSDYVSAVPDQLARFVGAAFTSLGTDGYGISDTRENLRRHFGIDAQGIAAAALRMLPGTDALTPRPRQQSPDQQGAIAAYSPQTTHQAENMVAP